MNCQYCNKLIEITSLSIVQYYPEVLYECDCGTVIDDKGNDNTEEYYRE